MRPDHEPIELAYVRDGFVIVPDLLDTETVHVLRQEAERFDQGQSGPSSVFDAHAQSEIFSRLTRLAAIVEPIQQLLGSSPMYVSHTQLTNKLAGVWDPPLWHQDGYFSRKPGGVRVSGAITVGVLLDDCGWIDGPIVLIPESHSAGIVDHIPVGDERNGHGNPPEGARFCLPPLVVRDAMARRAPVAAIGAQGTAFIYGEATFHVATQNVAPANRRIFYVDYNKFDRVPRTACSVEPVRELVP